MLVSALVCFAAVSASVEAKVDCPAQANAFAFALADKMGFSNSKKNELMSPISINMDFTMLLNGMTGKTSRELAKALGWPIDSLSRVNSWASSMLKSSKSEDGAQVVFANAIFSRRISLKPAYMAQMKAFYFAELGKLPDRDSEALAKINAWSNQHTKQRIPKILDRLNPNDCLVLLNAVTFDGQWSSKFESAKSFRSLFDGPSGRTPCLLMNNPSGTYPYCEDRAGQYLQLGYRGSRYAMLLMLPKPGQKLSNVFTAKTFARVQPLLKHQSGSVSIPKVRFVRDYDLVAPMVSLGAKRLFQLTTDYGKMAPAQELGVSQAVHRSYIEINEDGTKAGAVTAVLLHCKGLAGKSEFSFIASHPFGLVLYDTTSKAILFLGVVNNP